VVAAASSVLRESLARVPRNLPGALLTMKLGLTSCTRNCCELLAAWLLPASSLSSTASWLSWSFCSPHLFAQLGIAALICKAAAKVHFHFVSPEAPYLLAFASAQHLHRFHRRRNPLNSSASVENFNASLGPTSAQVTSSTQKHTQRAAASASAAPAGNASNLDWITVTPRQFFARADLPAAE